MRCSLQLQLYAQSATTSPTAGTKSISESYITYAASWTEIQDDAVISDFAKVWLHLVLFMFPLLTWLMLYLCDPVNLLLGDKTWQKLDDENTHPKIAALIQVSALFTIFVFVLDWIAFAQTITGDFLTADKNASFYLSAVTGMLIDFCAIGWVMYVLVSVCHFDCKTWKFWDHENYEKQECPEHTKKLMSTIMLAPILCIANHLYYIILAFISDPIHAGFITYAYIISFFLFYFVFRQFYGRVVLRSNRRQQIWEKEKLAVNIATSQLDLRYRLSVVAKEKGDEEAYRMFMESGEAPKPVKVKPRRRILRIPFNTQVVVIGLVLIGPILVLYEFIITMLFLSLPISKSLEAVPTSFFSIYGMGFIIVILLTYSIVLLPSPFSLSKAAEKIGRDLHLPRYYPNWHKFTDEEKCACLVTYLMRHRKDLSPSPEPEHSDEVQEGNSSRRMRLIEEQPDDIDDKLLRRRVMSSDGRLSPILESIKVHSETSA